MKTRVIRTLSIDLEYDYIVEYKNGDGSWQKIGYRHKDQESAIVSANKLIRMSSAPTIMWESN